MAQVRRFTLQPTWGGGLSTTRSPWLIGENEAPSLNDAVIVEDGLISPARAIQTAATDSGAGTESIRGIIGTRDTAGGALYALFVDGTKLRRWNMTMGATLGAGITDITNGQTLTLTGGVTRKAVFIPYNGATLFINGNDAPLTMSGSAAATVLGGSPPSASKYGCVHQDHVLLLQQNGQIQAADYQSVTSWPAVLLFTPVKFSGSLATGIVDRGDYCYVFFEDAIWRFDLIGRTYRRIEETVGLGCPYPYTIQSYKGGVVYLGPDNVYYFGGGTPQPMTRGIEDTITTDSNRVIPQQGNEEAPWAAVVDTRYYLFYASNQGSTIDSALTFDFRYGAWYGPEGWSGDAGYTDIKPDSDGIKRAYFGNGLFVRRIPHSSATLQSNFNAQTRAFNFNQFGWARGKVNYIRYLAKGNNTGAAVASRGLPDSTLRFAIRMYENGSWTNLSAGYTKDQPAASYNGWRRFEIPVGPTDSKTNTIGGLVQVKVTQGSEATPPEFTLGLIEVEAAQSEGD